MAQCNEFGLPHQEMVNCAFLLHYIILVPCGQPDHSTTTGSGRFKSDGFFWWLNSSQLRNLRFYGNAMSKSHHDRLSGSISDGYITGPSVYSITSESMAIASFNIDVIFSIFNEASSSCCSWPSFRCSGIFFAKFLYDLASLLLLYYASLINTFYYAP